MKILNTYIAKTVISSILMVLLVLLGVESFLEFGNELKDIGKGNFHFWQALLDVPLMMPTDIYELFPMAALIGCLMGLGKLANQSELVVMSAAGVSRWQIMRALLQAALLLLLVVSLIGEVLAPRLRHYAKDSKALAITGGQTLITDSGVWFRDGNNFIFVGDILLGNRLSEIVRYRFDDHQRLTLASHAKKGLYDKGHWYFYDVDQSEIFKDHVLGRYIPVQQWDIHLDKRLLGLSNSEPNQMTLTKLYSYISYRHKNDLGTGLYEFNFWKRVIAPLSSLVMIFLAIPFIFGPLRSVSMGLRVVTGVIIGAGFFILNQFFGPISQVYQIPAMLAAVLPTITFAIMGTFLLFLKT